MTLCLETKKLKRTGYLIAFPAGGLLAAAFPLVNMLVRPEAFTSLPGSPLAVLLDANWQMMAMLNILVSICGACIMYHTEYADNGAQKMELLPVRTGRLFGWKFVLAALALASMVAIETAALAGCARQWFPAYEVSVGALLGTAGFQWFVTLPTVMLMLGIASACKNMWVSLGVGVILVFSLSIFPQEHPVLSLLPFSSPYQTLTAAMDRHRVPLFLVVCGVQTGALGLLALLYQKVGRCRA